MDTDTIYIVCPSLPYKCTVTRVMNQVLDTRVARIRKGGVLDPITNYCSAFIADNVLYIRIYTTILFSASFFPLLAFIVQEFQLAHYIKHYSSALGEISGS